MHTFLGIPIDRKSVLTIIYNQWQRSILCFKNLIFLDKKRRKKAVQNDLVQKINKAIIPAAGLGTRLNPPH